MKSVSQCIEYRCADIDSVHLYAPVGRAGRSWRANRSIMSSVLSPYRVSRVILHNLDYDNSMLLDTDVGCPSTRPPRHVHSLDTLL